MRYNKLLFVLFALVINIGNSMSLSYLSSFMILPSTDEIISVKKIHCWQKSDELTEETIKNLFKKTRIIEKNNKLLNDWNYAPWCDAELNTSIGKFHIELFLGGLGFVANNKKDVVAVLFE